MTDTAKTSLSVHYVDVEKLIPYARNTRTHDDAQIAQLAASLREFGWTKPVLVDGEHGIIAGHGIVLAARKLGIQQIPVISLSHLSPAQRRAYVMADNKLAEHSGWDADMLAIELADLKDTGYDVGVLGFTAKELADLLSVSDFSPGAEGDQGRLDEKTPTVCPNCGHEF